jgi:hypothetical protein
MAGDVAWPLRGCEKPVQKPSLTHEDSLAFSLEHPLESRPGFRGDTGPLL